MNLGAALGIATLIVAAVGLWLAYGPFRSDRVTKEKVRFAQDRQDLRTGRSQLVVAASSLYPISDFIAGSRCLSPQQWRVKSPIPVENVVVTFDECHKDPLTVGTSSKARRLLPRRSPSRAYHRYSDVLGDDDELRPKLWWNGPSFDLTSYEIRDGSIAIGCSSAPYFDMLDVCESVSHEYLVHSHKRRQPDIGSLPYRSEIGDPYDISRRVFVPAIPILPLFQSSPERATFLMHSRDHSQVASAGGSRHLVGGQFQPSSKNVIEFALDAHIWLSIAREFAEELLGFEDAGGHARARLAFDEPPFSDLQQLRDNGSFRVWVLGMGLDPLSLWPDILSVAVIDQTAFSQAFPKKLASTNDEGLILGESTHRGDVQGFEFSEDSIKRICDDIETAPAAAACLQLAWEHRQTLLV